ncbi:MAG: hypothetical protein HKN34_08980 [Gammaproteobacteria bacterium]|nr:hypothetical protein [Gammaproteobacteria bacterium]
MQALDDKDIFELVYDRNILPDVVYFLQEGFNWGQEYSQKILKALNSIDDNIPVAAVNKSSGGITIAILLFHQGVSEESKKAILNISAWYAVPEERGIPALNFARKLLRNLDDYILTVYTPTATAYKVFKSIGFSEMAVGKITIGLVNRYPFFSFPSLHTLRVIQAGAQKKSTHFKESSEKIVHISNISATRVDQAGALYYSLRSTKKFIFKLNVISVYAINAWPANVTLTQVLWLALKRRAVSIDVFYKVDNGMVNKSNWLIYPASVPEKVIAPVGSELILDDK